MVFTALAESFESVATVSALPPGAGKRLRGQRNPALQEPLACGDLRAECFITILGPSPLFHATLYGGDLNLLFYFKLRTGDESRERGKHRRQARTQPTSQRRKTQGPGKGLEEAKNRWAPHPGKRGWEGLQTTRSAEPQRGPSKSSPITTGTGL